MAHTYSVIRPMRDPAVTRVTFDSLDDPEVLLRGERLRDSWEGAELTVVDPRASIMDLVDNHLGVLIVSPDLRAVLEHNQAPAVEFLPVTIVTEDGETVADDFFIANNRVLVDAMDRVTSAFTDVDGEVGSITQLVLMDTFKVNGPRLARMAERPDLVLVRDDLLTGLQASGVAGLDPVDTRDFFG